MIYTGKLRSVISITIIILLITGCSTREKPEATPLSTGIPESPDHAVIINNTFTSETLGISMDLPGNWRITYKTIPDYLVHSSRVSEFDSTIPENGLSPIIIYENGIIAFFINKEDEGNPDLFLIASANEYEGIGIEQAVENIQNGFSEKDSIIFEDMPDIVLKDMSIRRFRISENGFKHTIHVFLNNGYTIMVSTNHKYEPDYAEIVDTISTMQIVNSEGKGK